MMRTEDDGYITVHPALPHLSKVETATFARGKRDGAAGHAPSQSDGDYMAGWLSGNLERRVERREARLACTCPCHTDPAVSHCFPCC